MIDRYILMDKDLEVGELTYNVADKKFSFNRYENVTNRTHLPLGMYSYINWNHNYKPTHDDIVFWLSDRVVPKERQNIDEILRVMGLIDYDMWELCRRTRAMCMEDYFWLSKGEKFEEVHIRYLSEHGRIKETPIPFPVEEYPQEYIVTKDGKITKNLVR